MFLETTLLFKTLVILSGQIIVILATCFYFLLRAKKAYENNTTFFGISFKGSVNLKGKLDLIPYLKPQDNTKWLDKLILSRTRNTRYQKILRNLRKKLLY